MHARMLDARNRVVQIAFERLTCSCSHMRHGRSLMDRFIDPHSIRQTYLTISKEPTVSHQVLRGKHTSSKPIQKRRKGTTIMSSNKEVYNLSHIYNPPRPLITPTTGFKKTHHIPPVFLAKITSTTEHQSL